MHTDEASVALFKKFNDAPYYSNSIFFAVTERSVFTGKAQTHAFLYGAEASVGDSYFETREYEDFTLPAGNYRSLIIRLGSAEGKNWWCVVFPGVCVPAASDARLSDSTCEESASIAEHPKKYEIRFKAVEIYEDIKKFFSRE